MDHQQASTIPISRRDQNTDYAPDASTQANTKAGAGNHTPKMERQQLRSIQDSWRQNYAGDINAISQYKRH